MVKYEYLTAEQRQHFLEHGWLRIPNAIKPEYLDGWMADCWIRLGFDEHDVSTWTEEYVKLPRHREVPVAEFCPDAYKAMVEIVGGADRIDPNRETHHGDQFIINSGTEYWRDHDQSPQEASGWHTDNDWYRQFLDSSGNALTIIHCFTDIDPRGGGTWLCEDGITGIVEYLYAHPEGLDPPFDELYAHVKECKVFTEVTAKRGDTLILHGLLPHTASKNHLRKPRVITNPHVNLKDPYQFDREDPEDFSLCELYILNALGKKRIPPSEWHIAAPRKVYYPRNYTFKKARVEQELERMLAAAAAKGLGPESVDSVYLRSEAELREHEKRNGLAAPPGPNAFPDGTRTYYKMPVRRAED
ncbi:hypothetical protein CALCODRAFT_495048 [Calocera cornea HHB12733]|uniref:Phytanoyl-CoA dioxygenase family protein n=1 Tax=Calocera cornea HHB12733 TaxID=1353952 RepID=A0A165GPR8_9BASI|nr:hypothetical protein CALCODRAFT_495048 [Calocera cornea HHB12733]